MIIQNLPRGHDSYLIEELCSLYGKVTFVQLVHDGEAVVEFSTETEAKHALQQIMGMQVDNKVLYVKKMQPPTEEELL